MAHSHDTLPSSCASTLSGGLLVPPERWPLSPVFSLRPSIALPKAPAAAAELCFAWREPGSAALAQRLCGELVIHGIPPKALLQLSLCSGGLELMGLHTLDGARGESITAGEMLWGMASFQSPGGLGRLALPLRPEPVALGALRLQLWLAKGASAGCAVTAVAAPAAHG